MATTVTITTSTASTDYTLSTGARGPAGANGIDGEDGSDANVTSGNIATALGYTPASNAVTISAGTGLTGGGSLATNRTLSLDNTAVAAGSYTKSNITVDAQGRITSAANGSVSNAEVNTAIATSPTATAAELDGTDDLVNAQPHCADKFRLATAPLRILIAGDSLSQISGGVKLGPKMSLAGYFGMLPVSGTESGTITAHGYGSEATRGDYWINGQARTYAVGAQSDFSTNGQSGASGLLQADKASVYYIKKSGGGTFQLQYQANNTGSWTSLGTIDTSNGTTIGAATEFSLPTTNAPFYKLRIASVSTGPVVVVAVNLYNSTGGGVTWSNLGGRGGMDPAEIATTPAAVFDPIWTALAPDCVIAIWADEANEFESGGGWDAFYDRAAAIKATTDWVLVSANPNADSPTRGTGYLYEQQRAQRAWALANRQTYINGYNIFHDWATAIARGWVIHSTDPTDLVHPSDAGATFRNAHMWSVLPLGSYDLGGIGGSAPGEVPALAYSFASTGSITANKGLRLSAGTFPLRIASASTPLDSSKDWRFYQSSDELLINTSGGSGLKLTNQANYRGLMPINAGDELGKADSTANRWNLNTAGITGLVWAITSANSPYPLDRYIYTATLDATGGNVSCTLPAANASYMTGREYRIKRLKSDVSGNTATITGTIDGVANPTLAAGDCWIIQSNGSVWMRIS